MANEEVKPNQIPEDIQQQAQEQIRDAFGFFKNHTKEMKERSTEFRKFDQEVKERINRGARRTNGRIV